MRLKTILLFVAFLTSTIDFATGHHAGQQASAPNNATARQAVAEVTTVTSARPQGISSEQTASQDANHGGLASPGTVTAQPVSHYPNDSTQQSSPSPGSTSAPKSSPNPTSTIAAQSSSNPTPPTPPQSSSSPTTIQNPTTTEKGIQTSTTRKITTLSPTTHASSNFGSGFAVGMFTTILLSATIYGVYWLYNRVRVQELLHVPLISSSFQELRSDA